MPYVTIDGQNYILDEKETHWSISDFSHSLKVQFVVASADIKSDTRKKLLDEYRDDGRIKFLFEATGIFEKGVPTGELTYEADRNEASYSYLNKEGLDYGPNFFGTICYRDAQVVLEGELKPTYEEFPVFLIKAALRFDPQELDWSQYRFKSLEESADANPETVRFLELLNPDFGELPDSIYRYVHLEELTILNKRDYWDQTKLLLSSLGERLGQLKYLKSISINRASITALPSSMESLQNLELLNFSQCELRAVPDVIWKLPKLNFLMLSGNHISSMPEMINLPMLKTLAIENNQLKTLPEALAAQPKLNTIRASGNPFESLPDRFSYFRGLELDIKEKKKLLDTSYPGADGKGITDWDDSLYTADADEGLMAPVDEIIKQNKLAKVKKPLRSLIKRSVGFLQTAAEDYTDLGNHRFGGRPDLPEDVPYPTFFDGEEDRAIHYEFIAQINCEQIASLQAYLPRTGTLFFFFKSFHFFGTADDDIARVIYVEDNLNLSSGTRFDLAETDFFELFGGQYSPFKAEAFPVVSAPSFYAIRENSYLLDGKAKALRGQDELMEELYERFEEPLAGLQPVDHGVNVYGFTQHESPELQAALSQKGNPADWVVLLTVKSRGDFMWGDAGDLFFVMHKSDLAKQDFSRVFVTMESS